MRLIACFFLTIAAALAWPASAQDIPGRVGRLSYVDGSVGLYQDPDRGWDEAYVNSPITSRNSVWTEPGSRAEVVVGPTALRLDEASQLDVSLLDDTTLDATLESGTAAVNIRHFRIGDIVRLSTPRASFLLQARGRYRLDADPDRGETRLSVFSGQAAMETADGLVRIRAGQSVVVWGENAEYAYQDTFLTEFDRWAAARDARWAESRAPQYVSYEMTGYEDLDAYGEWSQDAVYGALWFPTRVESDWAPYRFGRWTYLQPWGWTWVDNEPWGFAPSHYGRWVHVRDRWAWCPGRRVDRPTWAPALVGFIGGGNWSASVSSGAPVVGWYPLAPSEPYHPWYSASRNYVGRVNAVVVNVPERVARPHVEWNRDRAATVVRREALVERRPVQQARVQVAPAVVRSAPVLTAPSNVLPSREEFHQARRNQIARAPAPPAANRGAPAVRNGPAASSTPPANALARPSFAKPSAPPRAAPSNATPPAPSAIARRPSPPGQATAGNPPQAEQQRAAREAQQQRERTSREAQQQQERTSREREQRERAVQDQQRVERERAAQQQRTEQQRAAREGEQERQRASREAAQQQQRAAQEQQRQQAAQQRAQQEEQRAAREAEQQRQRASREAAQQQQRAAQEQERQQRAAQQRAQQEQQRASREAAQQQQQRAAQEQQQRAAQEQQRAAQEQQQRAAQQAAHGPPQGRSEGRPQGQREEREKGRGQGEGGEPHG